MITVVKINCGPIPNSGTTVPVVLFKHLEHFKIIIHVRSTSIHTNFEFDMPVMVKRKKIFS